MPESGKSSRYPFGRPRARITLFHVFWFLLTFVIASASSAWAVQRHLTGAWCITFFVIGCVGGFIVAHFVIFLFVTCLVIPFTHPRSYWEYEVNCYMSHVVGKKWDDLDETPL